MEIIQIKRSFLVSQCYDISDFTNTVVQFDMAFDLEADWDYITFEYSIDAGYMDNPRNFRR
jgi:hypothetical protein